MGKFTAAKVKTLMDQPGRHSDGDGLILFVRKPGQASWVARVQHNNKRRDYGIGSAKMFKLAEARDRAWQVRRALVDGRDPRTLWDTPEKLLWTFREAAEGLLAAKVSDPKNQKQKRSQLLSYVYPTMGRLQVQTIDADRIADCLRPIWTTKPEVARKLRTLIIQTLGFTRPDAGLFEGTLAKAISQRLPKQPAKGNFDALPYQDLPAYMDRLASKTSMGALALQLAILCASRSGEIRGATWGEIDFERGIWTIPAERMKMRKPHRVPLSPQALSVLEKARQIRRGNTEHIFPNGKGVALSDMALTKTLRDMGMNCTVHGFRSTFRDWAADQTSVAGDVAEAALAHAVPNAVEAAYKRTDFFDLRRGLMDSWGRFATGEGSADVVQLAAAQ
ncbi:tyrosine-type recombinase/integrase [Sphingorhabdus sp.]|uniref:tyrosine-type recombinase/integrase n=1 Tax=Sphingorhabdus sp. TaxID=1902408 RepID=UPI00391D3FD3